MELNEEQRRTVLAAARERKRKQRERDQQKRIRALEAQKTATERAERRRRNLHFYGESAPGRNAETLMDELMIHRQFLRALRGPDVRDGESLHSVAQRTYQAWITGPFASRDCHGRFYVPAFNSTTQEFDPDFGFGLNNVPFDEVWTPPKDCSGDERIDIGRLPKLPNLPKAPVKEEPTPEPVAPPPPPAMAVPPEQPNAINFTWVHPSANRYLNGRWAHPNGEIQ
jgi:hypothetical protein